MQEVAPIAEAGLAAVGVELGQALVDLATPERLDVRVAVGARRERELPLALRVVRCCRVEARHHLARLAAVVGVDPRVDDERVLPWGVGAVGPIPASRKDPESAGELGPPTEPGAHVPGFNYGVGAHGA